jgi:hypothetical protein
VELAEFAAIFGGKPLNRHGLNIKDDIPEGITLEVIALNTPEYDGADARCSFRRLVLIFGVSKAHRKLPAGPGRAICRGSGGAARVNVIERLSPAMKCARYTGFAQKGVNRMFALLAYIIGLFGTLILIAGGLMYVVDTLINRRLGPVVVPAGILCGYIGGALFVWSLIPREWTLPFWTTLAAAGNAEKYGHPVEHYAEGIIIAMMFAAVVGAVIGGFSTYFGGRFLRQRRAA